MADESRRIRLRARWKRREDDFVKDRKQVAMETAEPMQPLQDGALAAAVGGVGYASIQCKKCGKAFADMEAYRKHVETGCKTVKTR